MSSNDHTHLRPWRTIERRVSRKIRVGTVEVGGDAPITVQSMTNTLTSDAGATIDQIRRLEEAGADIVRVSCPDEASTAALPTIVKASKVPIVADIHFHYKRGIEAAKAGAACLRINPGNIGRPDRVRDVIQAARDYGCSMRIGVNAGSLEPHLLEKYGEPCPQAMVESALDHARILQDHDFHEFKISVKASDIFMTVAAYQMLAEAIDCPLHVGVTEAGEGEDGRIKSAIGIGSLLCDGLGDTIRVSLTEDSPRELEVCADLLAQIPILSNSKFEIRNSEFPFDPFHFEKRETPEIELNENIKCGGEQLIRVVVTRATFDKVAPKIRPKDDVKPEAVYEDLNIAELDPTQDFEINCETQLVTVKDGVNLPAITAFRLLAAKLKKLGRNNPILLKDCINFEAVPLEPKIALLRASVVIGALLADGIGDAILVRGEAGGGQSLRLAYNILQAAGCRSFKTDYVACPSCGRTLFNLQTVTARIKARTEHLKGVKIAIMGCIVNGPGEMADADFGYVGGAPNKINLYVGKTPIKFNIPEAEAVERLVDLIKEHNKWVEPEPADTVGRH